MRRPKKKPAIRKKKKKKKKHFEIDLCPRCMERGRHLLKKKKKDGKKKKSLISPPTWIGWRKSKIRKRKTAPRVRRKTKGWAKKKKSWKPKRKKEKLSASPQIANRQRKINPIQKRKIGGRSRHRLGESNRKKMRPETIPSHRRKGMNSPC